MSTPHPVIAIDGPAASGKSSVARLIAQRLGWRYVNTGNMYRAVTAVVSARGLDRNDQDAIAALAASLALDFTENGSQHIVTRVDGTALTDDQLNSEEVNTSVSYIARVPAVRDRLVAEQRALSTRGPLVMEGRDIGSVVFPCTPHKFYIDASEEVRAKRRQAQGHADTVSLRDKMDSTRATAPLVIPEGACYIDSSDLTLEAVVDAALHRLQKDGIHPR